MAEAAYGAGPALLWAPHFWVPRALLYKIAEFSSYEEDGHLQKRRAIMEKTNSHGKDGQLRKRRAVMQDRQLRTKRRLSFV